MGRRWLRQMYSQSWRLRKSVTMRDLVSLRHSPPIVTAVSIRHGSIAEIYWSKTFSIGKHPHRQTTHYGNSVGEDENSSQLIAYRFADGNAHQVRWLVNDQDSYFDCSAFTEQCLSDTGLAKTCVFQIPGTAYQSRYPQSSLWSNHDPGS